MVVFWQDEGKGREITILKVMNSVHSAVHHGSRVGFLEVKNEVNEEKFSIVDGKKMLD